MSRPTSTKVHDVAIWHHGLQARYRLTNACRCAEHLCSSRRLVQRVNERFAGKVLLNVVMQLDRPAALGADIAGTHGIRACRALSASRADAATHEAGYPGGGEERPEDRGVEDRVDGEA